MESEMEISTAQAAAILGVTPQHVRWYYAKDKLPGRRIGERVLVFKRADVEKLKLAKPKKTGRPRKSPKKPAKSKPKKPD